MVGRGDKNEIFAFVGPNLETEKGIKANYINIICATNKAKHKLL